jgi:hypothetical protein
MIEDGGYYYLHENGELIWKKFRPAQEPGGFVRKVWPVNTAERGCAWLICIEALAMGARRERVMELAAKWGLTDDDAQEFVKHATIGHATAGYHPAFILFRDGDRWCAGFHDFVNVQESQCGFGLTVLEAFAELAKPGLTGVKV